MSKFFLKSVLSAGNSAILDTLFYAKQDELSEEKVNVTIEEKERFLDIVSNVKDKELRQRLINIYLKDDDKMGEECAKLTKKYYKNGFSDGINLIIECTKVGDKNGYNLF